MRNGAVVQEVGYFADTYCMCEKGAIVFLEPKSEGTRFVAAYDLVLNFIIHYSLVR